MRANNLLRHQVVLPKPFKNSGRILSRIDDDGLTGRLVAENRAVALKNTDRESFDDHRTSWAPMTLTVPRVAAPRLLKSTLPTIRSSPGGSFCLTVSVSFSRTFPLSSRYVAWSWISS